MKTKPKPTEIEKQLRSALQELTDAIENYQKCEPHLIIMTWNNIKKSASNIKKEFNL